MPQRIQRKRTAGWKMPEGAVYVGRPSRWGNPFSVDTWGLDMSLALFSDAVQGIWNPWVLAGYTDAEVNTAYEAVLSWRTRLNWGHPLEGARYELQGRDLACWCPLDRKCHADLLLELANPELANRGNN